MPLFLSNLTLKNQIYPENEFFILISYVHINWNPIANYHQDILHSTSPIHQDTGFQVFFYPGGLIVTSKSDFFFFFKQNKPNQNGQWVNILFWALQLHCLQSLRAGRQGNPVRAAESSADVSVVFTQTEKEERWPSDNRQLSIRWHAHTW